MEKAGIEQPQSLSGQLRLELIPQLSEIGRLVKAFEEFARKLGISSIVTQEVTLVLDELVTNIVSHGVDPEETKPIVVDFSYRATLLKIEMSDPGRPFDPRSVPSPDTSAPLDTRKIGGLGIHFARTIMDAIDHRYEGGRNHVILLKRIVEDA